MSSDPEHFLERLLPRGAPASVRQRVLDEVARELAAPPRTHRLRWTGAALAASLLLSIALNIGLARARDARLARIYGPPPVPRQLIEMAQTVETVAGAETASWFQREWLAAIRRRPLPSQGRVNIWIDYSSQLLGKDWPHEEASEGPDLRRDRRRGARGALPACQCRLGLDLQRTT